MDRLEHGTWAGFGIAGNFAGHLDQAGETPDFASLNLRGEGPKGMFPFHVPIEGHFLSVDPLSSWELRLPVEGGQVQVEPETALRCRLAYGKDGQVSVRVVAFAAFDDASIRREGARKISEKKNWGPGSKGVSADWIPLADGLHAGCPLDEFRIASFLRRDGAWQAYGIDSPVKGYSLYGQPLVAWIEQQLSSQRDQGPLEDLSALLAQAGRPENAIITIGATRYTDLGEKTFVKAGDRTAVAVYHPGKVSSDHLMDLIDRPVQVAGLSLLVRDVVRAGA